MVGEHATRNPQATGVAATALVVQLMRTLIAKGALSPAEADEVVGNAIGEVRQNQSSVCRAAVEILEQDVAPEFARR